jgi:hypothetical protein
MTPRRALIALIVVSGLLRVVWAATAGLGHDESYHYLFTVHRDWSYFDHPPMLAWVEQVGTTLFGVTTPLALRFGFCLLFAGSTYLMFQIASRAFGERVGFLAALGLNVSAYHTAAAGAFALPDGPLLFFWLLTIDRIDLALRDENSLLGWLWVGLAWGGAMLSKYHGIFLPAGLVVYILITPKSRGLLLKPGPYLATIIGSAMFAPVLWWNAKHGWASFVFQGGRAVANAGFNPLALFGSFAGSALYLFPWIWIAMLIGLYQTVRRWLRHETSDSERLLMSQSMTPLILFSMVASVRPILPHWTLVAYLSVYPLLGRLWAERLDLAPVKFRRKLIVAGAVPVAVASLMVFQYHSGFIPMNKLVKKPDEAVRADPTAELYGWEQIATELKVRGLLEEKNNFLFTSNWFLSGHVGYITRGSGVPVTCYNPGDARGFAFWSDPDQWLGRDGILVSFQDPRIEPACYKGYFDSIENITSFPIMREGKAIRTVHLYRCKRQTQPFPYIYQSGPRPRSLAQMAELARQRK